MNKDELRKHYKEKRLVLFEKGEIERISNRICLNLRKEEVYKKAENIMFFYPKGSEINLLELCTDDKKFFLPRVKDKELEVCPYKIGDRLNLSEFKVSEPVGEALCNLSIIDLILTPALAVDKKGFRLGYGGGFYDRFFKERSLKAKKIVVIANDFVVESLPHESFDVPCDIVLTEDNFMSLLQSP